MKFCPICDVRLKKDNTTSVLTCPKCNHTQDESVKQPTLQKNHTEFPITDESVIKQLDSWSHGNLNHISATRQSDKYEQKSVEEDQDVISKNRESETRDTLARKIAKETEEARKEDASKITGWNGTILSSQQEKSKRYRELQDIIKKAWNNEKNN